MCNEECSEEKDQTFIRCCECGIGLGCDSLKCLAFGNDVECQKVQGAADRARALAKSLGLKEINEDEMGDLIKNMLREDYGIEEKK